MSHVLKSIAGPAKLPRLLAGQIARPLLRQRLLEGDYRLRLLFAPAGSGKSLLLSECLAQCPKGTDLTYLDLRGAATSPERLRQLLAQALDGPEAEPGGAEEQLGHISKPLWLVLDDYPRMPDAALDHALNELMLSSSHQVRWWIASRRRPALQLERLLLDDSLLELQADELAFSITELHELLKAKGLSWPPTAVEKLHSMSRGWCAGVRLHLLNQIPGQEPASSALRTERLLDYLKREVLDELPGDWRQALFTLALLPHFDAGLCEQLFGMGEGAQQLAQLQSCGLFICPDRQTRHLFQLQPMVAQALVGQLSTSLAKAAFRRACQWYINQGQVRLAMEYAIRADQPEVAVSLMEQCSEDFILQGRSLAQILKWQDQLPRELLYSTSRLVLLNAWVLLFSGRLDEAQACSEHLAAFLPQPTAGKQQALLSQWQALQANLAFHRGNAPQARIYLDTALAELPERAWGARLMCQTLQLEQALIEGQFDNAKQLNRCATRQARERASQALESILVLGHVKLLEIRGELLRAESLLRRLHDELSSVWHGEASPMRGRTHLRLGNLLLQLGRYPEAESSFCAGLTEAQECGDPAALWAYLGLAELAARQGKLTLAFTHIADGERLMQCRHVSESLYQGLLLRTRARLWLLQGRSDLAEHSLLAAPLATLPPYGAPDLHLQLRLLLLRAQLANGAIDQARDGLHSLYDQVQVEGRQVLVCEVGFTLAEALYASNRSGQGKQSLLQAIGQARRMSLVDSERSFARRCPTLVQGLNTRQQPEGAPVALLSRRELEVLKLIVRGYSNQQIAESLFISLHTVKTHTQHIHCKLGVERRTQAIARAKELGLG